jgi:hypothetical protein
VAGERREDGDKQSVQTGEQIRNGDVDGSEESVETQLGYERAQSGAPILGKRQYNEERCKGRNPIEDLVDEVREVFIVGAHVSGSVGEELGGRSVQRIGELIEKGYDTRGRQFALRPR